MAPDIPTLMMMVTVAAMVMAATLMAVAWGERSDGIKLWAGALCCLALAYVLFLLRGRIPDPVSILLGNGLASAATSLVLAAICRFQGRALPWLAMLLPPLALVGLLWLFLDDFTTRVTLTALIMAGQSAWVFWALWERRSAYQGRGVRLVMAAMGLQTVVLLVRGASSASRAMGAQNMLQADAIQILTFVSAFASLLVASLGFIFMHKERADEANRRLAALDELTGVANRRSIIAALDRDVSRAIRTREPLAVMMVDIDFFKHINDTHGHLAGDQVLRNVVDVIRHRIRAQDIVGRYGGEEFMVLLCDTTLQGARQLAEQLREAVQASFCPWNGERLAVTVSVGVFGGRLEPGDGWDQLIHAADQALYRAKQGGRNRVEIAPTLGRLAGHGRANGSPETLPSSLH